MLPLAAAVTKEPHVSAVSSKKMVMRLGRMPRSIAFWTTERANLWFRELQFHWRMESLTFQLKNIQSIISTICLKSHFQECNPASRESANKLWKLRMEKANIILWISNQLPQEACIWRALTIWKFKQFCLQIALVVQSYLWYVNLFWSILGVLWTTSSRLLQTGTQRWCRRWTSR